MTERHQYLPNLGEIKRASYGARLGHKDQTTCAAARLGRDDLLMELLLDDFETTARLESPTPLTPYARCVPPGVEMVVERGAQPRVFPVGLK